MSTEQVNKKLNYSIKQYHWFCNYWRAIHTVSYEITHPQTASQGPWQIIGINSKSYARTHHIWLYPIQRSLTFKGVCRNPLWVPLTKLSAFCDLSSEIPRKDFPTQLYCHIGHRIKPWRVFVEVFF